MRTRKTKLENLTAAQIESITSAANRRRGVPLLASRQVNMRLDPDTLEKVKKLAAVQGVPYTTFLARLLKEDIERLWDVFDKTG